MYVLCHVFIKGKNFATTVAYVELVSVYRENKNGSVFHLEITYFYLRFFILHILENLPRHILPSCVKNSSRRKFFSEVRNDRTEILIKFKYLFVPIRIKMDVIGPLPTYGRWT